MVWPCKNQWKSTDCQKDPSLQTKVTNCKRPTRRPRMRWEDQVKLDL
jgi:hypothetical protein